MQLQLNPSNFLVILVFLLLLHLAQYVVWAKKVKCPDFLLWFLAV